MLYIGGSHDDQSLRQLLTGDLDTILEWADEFRRLGVRANADNPEDAELSRKFGAAGIGLCRTAPIAVPPIA